MNILAFDTCLGALSVAARWRGPGGEWLMRHAREVRDKGHAERLMPMMDEVMQEAGLAFSDIGRIAVTVGPGSFTGVRVGVAAARGLALASGIAAVGATSLAVMAHQADELLGQVRRGRLLAVAVDARRGSVYLQVFGEAHDAAAPPRLLAVDDAAGQIGTRPTIVVGSGASHGGGRRQGRRRPGRSDPARPAAGCALPGLARGRPCPRPSLAAPVSAATRRQAAGRPLPARASP